MVEINNHLYVPLLNLISRESFKCAELFIPSLYIALQLEQTIKTFYLLKLSFFSSLVRQVSRWLLINCCDTLTEHTGHSTARDTEDIIHMIELEINEVLSPFKKKKVHETERLHGNKPQLHGMYNTG